MAAGRVAGMVERERNHERDKGVYQANLRQPGHQRSGRCRGQRLDPDPGGRNQAPGLSGAGG